MKSTGSKLLNSNILSIAFMTLLSLSLWPAMATAQTQPDSNESASSEEVIVVNVWATSASTVTNSGDATGPVLSRGFVVAGSRAMTALREWQGHLAHTIRNGYPLDERGIALQRDRAADRLILAAMAASSDADRAGLNELRSQYEHLRRWSEDMVEAKRNMEMAQFYMSPTALENNSLFQKTVECADFLAPMLASGRLSEGSSCH